MFNMKIYYVIFIFNNIISVRETRQNEMATLGVRDRVAVLKWQIAEQMHQKSNGLISPIIGKDDFSDNYEYVDMRNRPITPIMDHDERKRHDKFKLKQIKTTTRDIRVVPKNLLRKSKRRRRPKLRAPKSELTEVFYRRHFDPEDETLAEWAFCQDLITPFLQGFKKDVRSLKVKTAKDSSVMRLIQLLSVDASNYTKDDIYSVLYQISNVQIRLYQWDTLALKLLLRTICPSHNGTHPHTLRDVQYGLRDLFHSWHLDIENTTNLLKQTRIFRPPCVRAGPYEGSTKKSQGTTYTKARKEKKKCPGNECDY